MSKFSTFNNSAGIQGTDESVGLRSTLPDAQANLRWTWNQVLVWMQSLLNINLLDRNQSNHIAANGTAGGGTPELRAVGADANIGLDVYTKGLGVIGLQADVDVFGVLATNGDDILTGGGSINTGGGSIVTGGGGLTTGGGSLVLGAGALTLSGLLTGANATLSGNMTAQVVNATFLLGAPQASIGVLDASTSFTTPSAVITNLQITGTLSGLSTVNIPTLTSSTAINANGALNVNANLNLLTAALTAGATQGAVGVTTPVARVTVVGTAGFGVTLPSVGGVSPVNGRTIVVRNEGANQMSVWPATGAEIDGGGANNPVVLNPGDARLFVSIGFAIVGNWISIELVSSLSNSVYPYRAESASTAFTASDYTIDCDTAGQTFTLPPVASVPVGKVYVLKNSNGGTITLAGDGAEEIDGSNTKNVTTGKCDIVQNTGTGWIILSS